MVEGLESLTQNGWEKSDDGLAIKKTFIFSNFIEALGWMVKAGVSAEKLNHHPEWKNVYKTINVLLTTHDKGSITSLDVKLAQEMDKLYES
ncbi:MAG: 4a-hydroxytetrahydrobiopterin dehydratase [Paracoccaceae bacterium]|jgi:4a-hydroxytetrahydrobiopterin dehydratase|nr:4a-hydroxytetrahydrobiopterin dehydratase [Paracoccaceae bacterium]MDG1676091.1 4a-hydroxytetrahydrobiopterin dehydratase [Paracoccaceae bacterium]MDG2248483.1 4a-hydroxytetrahydrobiopterin dehydratase [Paracoccaceae bacterium]|tara:strand:- start:295 stop:567 length:273 start_codon:yes stop_codon:yes gene_type:complete